MNKILLSFTFIFLTAACSAQSQPLNEGGLDSAYEVKNKTEKTLIINMSNYSIITFESLKEELISWKEKVKSIDINESSHQFTLVHFLILENRELFDVLNKYNIGKSDLISYK